MTKGIEEHCSFREVSAASFISCKKPCHGHMLAQAHNLLAQTIK
jgi:hypothetical protein